MRLPTDAIREIVFYPHLHCNPGEAPSILVYWREAGGCVLLTVFKPLTKPVADFGWYACSKLGDTPRIPQPYWDQLLEMLHEENISAVHF